MKVLSHWLLVSVLFFALGDGYAAETIPVAVALRFGPEVNSSVESLYQGVEFATSTFNRSQDAIHIELKKYSYRSDSKSIEDAAKKIKKDGVKFVIGGEMSDEAFTLLDQFKNSNILFITPTASNPRIGEGMPLAFRMNFSDDQVALKLARYLSELKGEGAIGVLHNTANSYSDYLTVEFLKQLKKAKPEMPEVVEFNYASTHPEFQPAVKQFKEKKVAWVVAFVVVNELESFYAQAAKLNFYPKYLGTDGWGSNELVYQKLVQEEPIKKFDGVQVIYWQKENKSPANLKFLEQFRREYNHSPDSSNAIAYDSGTVLYQALSMSKDQHTPDQVSKTLSSHTFNDLLTSPALKFNAHHSPEKELFLYQISGAGIQFIGSR